MFDNMFGIDVSLKATGPSTINNRPVPVKTEQAVSRQIVNEQPVNTKPVIKHEIRQPVPHQTHVQQNVDVSIAPAQIQPDDIMDISLY